MLNPPPNKDIVLGVLSFSPLTETERSIITRYVGRPDDDDEVKHERRKHKHKHAGKKGGILPSTTEIFGCEREKTDLRNAPRDVYFDKKENCVHGNISTITQCYNVKECQGFHYVENGLGGSRYRLSCPGVSGSSTTIRSGG